MADSNTCLMGRRPSPLTGPPVENIPKPIKKKKTALKVKTVKLQGSEVKDKEDPARSFHFPSRCVWLAFRWIPHADGRPPKF